MNYLSDAHSLQLLKELYGEDDDTPVARRGLVDDDDSRRLNEAIDAINGYLTHYGMPPVGNGEAWAEVMERIHALLRHMEDVLPAPAPTRALHPLYPEERK